MRVGGSKLLINIAHSSQMYFASDSGTIRSRANCERGWPPATEMQLQLAFAIEASRRPCSGEAGLSLGGSEGDDLRFTSVSRWSGRSGSTPQSKNMGHPCGVVPVERIELPTFGLQNRCSTAELNRRIESGSIGGRSSADRSARSNTRLARKGPAVDGLFRGHAGTKKTASRPPFSQCRRAAVYWQICRQAVFADGTRCRADRQSRCAGRSSGTSCDRRCCNRRWNRRGRVRWRWRPRCRPQRPLRRRRPRPARIRFRGCFAVIIPAVVAVAIGWPR